MKERNYCVYKHTSPSNKVYIGITSMKPKIRWGKDGIGYKRQQHFFRAIQKYGWDKFTHEILFEGLTKEEACQKETELIAFYKSNNSDFGYNHSTGGERGFTGCESKFKGKHIFNFGISLWNCAKAYEEEGLGEPDNDPRLYIVNYGNESYYFKDFSTSIDDIKFAPKEFIWYPDKVELTGNDEDNEILLSFILCFLMMKWTKFRNFSEEYFATDFFTWRNNIPFIPSWAISFDVGPAYCLCKLDSVFVRSELEEGESDMDA